MTLTKNFADTGYRESEVKMEQTGRDGFRTAIIDDGDALLRTKGGMPRVYPTKRKEPCADTLSPLTEVDAAANREYWEPTSGDDERVFSVDGLLSLPRRIVKTLKTLSSAAAETPSRAVSFRFAHEANPAVKRPGDLTETGRVLCTSGIPAWFKCGLAFVSAYCVEKISFAMGGCAVTLNFRATLAAPSGVHGGVNGNYTVTTETPLAFGASSLDFVAGSKRLSINLEAGQTFLEPYSYTVALALRGGELLPKENAGDTMPGAFFSLDKWGSPFKGFAHSTGLYVDHTRATKITKPDPKSFSYSAGRARYFNFSTQDDVPVEGADCVLKHDIQFNGGWSYPGQNYADTGAVYLADEEHLYRDGDGAIWRIRFSMATISEHVVEVKARLVERVDRWLDPSPAVVPRDLAVQQFSPMVAGNYPPAPYFSGMIVDSLPSGREASISINAPQGDNIMNPRDPEVSRLIKCIFSGDGGETGAGVSMVFEQLPTVTRYQTTEWRGPTTTPRTQWEFSNDPTIPSFCCPYSYKYWDLNVQDYVWRSSEQCAPGIVPYGLNKCIRNYPDYIARYGTEYNYESTYNWTFHVDIQLVARADDTWDVLRMEYVQNHHQRRVDVVPKAVNTTEYSFYCKPMEVGDGSMFPEGQQGSQPAASADYELTYEYHSDVMNVGRYDVRYSCGEHSITGFAEYRGSDNSTRDAEHSGIGSWRPGPNRYMAFDCTMRDENVSVTSMQTPFWNKRREGRRLETAHSSASESAPYDGNRNYTDTGTVYSGDPPEDMFWINILPRCVAGHTHEIEYNAEHALPPRTTVDRLIHGVAAAFPTSGYVACDDPRNTRIVLLPTADAGCFY